MKLKHTTLILIACSSLILGGCASVPTADSTLNTEAKQFQTPAEGKAGIYFFRDGLLGAALKKDIRINGECIGETAPNTFFFTEVPANQNYTLQTESEFSDNALHLNAESGMLYFVRQYIKLGVFVGGANLEFVDKEKAKAIINQPNMQLAVQGTCNNS